MAEAADTATLLETLETNKDTIREPDNIGRNPEQRMAMGEYPERLLVYSRELDTDHNEQPIFRKAWISEYTQEI